MRSILLVIAACSASACVQTPPPVADVPAAPIAVSEDARLTGFLDDEFAEELKLSPELATYLGREEGKDRFSDISDAGQLKALEAQRASVARMEAQFDRATLSASGRTNYDIWKNRLERSELAYEYRRFTPPFYSFLDSLHSDVPNFLINVHDVQNAADMRAYNSRVRAIPALVDTALAQTRLSEAQGIFAPRFQIERVISGSKAIVSGAPFTTDNADSPLWADAKAKVAKLESDNKITATEAANLLADSRTSLLTIQPAYQRIIGWAESALATAPSGRVGAVSLPGGTEWYAAALKMNTTLDLSADEIHRIGLAEVTRIQGEQNKLAREAGFADRDAFYADRKKRFPPQPWTDAMREDYLARANATIARNRSLLPARFNRFPEYRMEVIREPSFSEVAGGAAHAAGPSADGQRPGRVYVHMLGVAPDPALLTDLMCHEGVPGTRDGGRHSGSPDRDTAVPPGGRLRFVWRRLGAVRRAALQGDGRVSRHCVRLHAPRSGAVACSAAGGRYRHPCARMD